MLYKNTAELPPEIKKSLSPPDQEEYLKIFNVAWEQYKDDDSVKGKEERKATAHQVAWERVALPPTPFQG